MDYSDQVRGGTAKCRALKEDQKRYEALQRGDASEHLQCIAMSLLIACFIPHALTQLVCALPVDQL